MFGEPGKKHFHREFFEQRSNADFASASDFTKILVHLLVGGGGLASTSLLALAGSLKDSPELIQFVMIPCAGFLLCVIFGVYASLQFAAAHGKWGEKWEHEAKGEVRQAAEANEEAANYCDQATSLIRYGLFAFCLGSIAAAVIIFRYSQGHAAHP
jgi:hypothetical protein